MSRVNCCVLTCSVEEDPRVLALLPPLLLLLLLLLLLPLSLLLPPLLLLAAARAAAAAAAVSRTAAASMAVPRCCSSCDSCSCCRTATAAWESGDALVGGPALASHVCSASKARGCTGPSVCGCCKTWIYSAASLAVICTQQQCGATDRLSHSSKPTTTVVGHLTGLVVCCMASRCIHACGIHKETAGNNVHQ